MMQTLHAHSQEEARLYLTVTPCPNCSDGPWEITEEQDNTETDHTDGMLLARCVHCREKKKFLFDWSNQAEDRPEDPQHFLPEAINPTDHPSQIIDLGQWISLFYMLIEKASAVVDIEARRIGFRAAQCLDEALKFYTDDELPPESAFFADASKQAFAEHPEKFTRQRLRDMRGKLPDLRAMAARMTHDTLSENKKKWWQVWKR